MRDCELALEWINRKIDNCISQSEQEALSEHLSRCEACRSILTAYEELQVSILALEQEPPEGLAEGVMWRVRAEKQGKKPRRRVFGGVTALCAVAALLLVIVSSGTLDGILGMKSMNDAAAPESMMATTTNSATMDGLTGTSFKAAPEDDAEFEADTADMVEEPPAVPNTSDVPCDEPADGAMTERDTPSVPYACELRIYADEDQAKMIASGAELQPHAEGLCFAVTCRRAQEIFAEHAHEMELVWLDEDAPQDAPALIIILEPKN